MAREASVEEKSLALPDQTSTSAAILAPNLAAFCERVAMIGTALLFVGIPLAFGATYTFDMFDLPKMVYMRGVSIIVLTAWIIRSLAKREFSWRKTLLDWPVLAFAGANLLSTIHTVSLNLSIHGEYRRFEGIYTIINYLLLFFFVTNLYPWRIWPTNTSNSNGKLVDQEHEVLDVHEMSTFDLLKVAFGKLIGGIFQSRSLNLDSFNLLLTAQVVAGALVAAYGVAQHLDRDFVVYNPHGPSPVISTYGNVNFLAAYLIMVIPLGVGLLLLTQSVAKKVLLGICLLPMTMTLFYTTSRGAWLGFAISMIVMAVMLGRKVIARNLSLVIIVVAISVIPALASFDTVSSRTQAAFQQSGTSVQFRFDWWKSIVPLISDNIVLGTGVSTLEVVFPMYSSLEYAQGQGINTFLDKAHNEFLHLAATSGMVGLGTYLLVLVAFAGIAWGLWRKWIGDNEESSPDAVVEPQRTYVISLVAGVIAYLVQNQFSFGVIGIASLFWMMLGMVVVLGRKETADGNRRFTIPFKGELLQGLGLIVVLAAVAMFMLNFRPLQADVLYRQAKMDNDTKNYDASIAEYRQVVGLNPYQTEYWRGLGEAYANKAKIALAQPGGSTQTKNELLNQSIAAFKKATELNPAAFNWLFLAETYRLYDNNQGLVDAYQSYRTAVKMYPYYVFANRGLGDAASQLKMYSDAERAYQTVTLVEPHDVDAYVNLALAYVHTGKEDEQIAAWKRVLSLDSARFSAYYYLGSLYEKRGQKEEAKTTYNKVLAITPKPEQKEDYDRIKQQTQEALDRLDKVDKKE